MIGLDTTVEDVGSLLESPSLVLIGEGAAHPGHMRRAVQSGQARGNLAHDAHIAALGLEHGVRELWTTDRDFDRFPGVPMRNPFLRDRRPDPGGPELQPDPRRVPVQAQDDGLRVHLPEDEGPVESRVGLASARRIAGGASGRRGTSERRDPLRR